MVELCEKKGCAFYLVSSSGLGALAPWGSRSALVEPVTDGALCLVPPARGSPLAAEAPPRGKCSGETQLKLGVSEQLPVGLARGLASSQDITLGGTARPSQPFSGPASESCVE